jgi:hypothetical protein
MTLVIRVARRIKMKKTMYKIFITLIAALRYIRTSQSATGAMVLGALTILPGAVPVARMGTDAAVGSKTSAISSLLGAVAETNLAELPDLAFRRAGVLIGGKLDDKDRKTALWGREVSLTKADSFLQAGGKLAFNLRYFFGNTSQGEKTGTFLNRIRSGNEVVSQQTNLVLNSGEVKIIGTQCYLTPGRHVIYVSLDDDKVIKESGEGNNVQRFIVNVSDK